MSFHLFFVLFRSFEFGIITLFLFYTISSYVEDEALAKDC